MVQPARAEAMDPMTIITIAGAAVLVVAIIAVVVIANVRDEQRGASLETPTVIVPMAYAPAAAAGVAPPAPVLAVVDGGGIQGL